MRAIIVDDEPLMTRKFVRLTNDIKDLHIVGQLESAEDAIYCMKSDPVDVAFLDIDLPIMDGVSLAKELRKIRKDLLIVFVTAYDSYIGDSNEMGGDYYLLKPYNKEKIEIMMDRIRSLSVRQNKVVYIKTFGRFVVKKNGIPLPLTGKAKEIFALIVSRQGKEISNEEIYSTVWEGRPYSNAKMSVYYNALKRLRKILDKEGVGEILISTSRGQMANLDMIDCDFYKWKEKDSDKDNVFEGEFLSEYSWGEEFLSEIIDEL